MESLKELYRIGNGPSSSHTMGPAHAADLFRKMHPGAESYRVILYGSLAKTGKGHLTDDAIRQRLDPTPAEIIFDTETDATQFRHPNTMDLFALKSGESYDCWRVYSTGGGKIDIEGHKHEANPERYTLESYREIKEYCRQNRLRLWQYAEQCEGPQLWEYLGKVLDTMKGAVSRGLRTEGTLKGGLGVKRKAGFLYQQRHIDESAETHQNRIVCAYAFAVSEESASGGVVVTAPTCGASGVVPAVMLYEQERHGFSDTEILRALAAAGIIGNLIKTNASISGAECGCQAEVGSACSMAAAGLAELFEMGLDQIEYAAEVAMEHHLGLTCDPIAGLVQIPCIERNAVAAMRAINALSLANFLTNTRKISFDMVIETMYETGRDLFSKYRETSEGGLAKLYQEEIRKRDLL